MKLTQCCRPVPVWLLLAMCGGLSARAAAQTPDSLPTLPALPAVIDTPEALPVPREGPIQGRYPFGERPQAAGPGPAPIAPPPMSYLPESVPAGNGMGFGQWINPFRRSFHPTEQPNPAGALSQVEIAAATIKADAVNADRRRAAVRYLGTIDCTFNPEAENALLMALRIDRHESVRYEAALALSNSCCWTRKTLDALNQAMTGSNLDGCPGEKSDRVRWASWQALSRYAAAINPAHPKELPAQVSTSSIRRTAVDVPTSHTTSCFFPPGPTNLAKTGPSRNVDSVPLPPLRPIAPVPEVEPPMPTYEPTPLQQPMK